MLDYNELKETMRSGIWQALNLFFVDLENGDPRPDNQEGIDSFISHKFTTPYTAGASHEIHEGNTWRRVETPTFTLSLTVYASDKGDALNNAQALREWIRFQGYEYLKENDLIIESIEPMSDRTTFLETEYDNRVGFDVILRTTDTVERTIDTIETVVANDEPIE